MSNIYSNYLLQLFTSTTVVVLTPTIYTKHLRYANYLRQTSTPNIYFKYLRQTFTTDICLTPKFTTTIRQLFTPTTDCNYTFTSTVYSNYLRPIIYFNCFTPIICFNYRYLLQLFDPIIYIKYLNILMCSSDRGVFHISVFNSTPKLFSVSNLFVNL